MLVKAKDETRRRSPLRLRASVYGRSLMLGLERPNLNINRLQYRLPLF